MFNLDNLPLLIKFTISSDSVKYVHTAITYNLRSFVHFEINNDECTICIDKRNLINRLNNGEYIIVEQK